MSFSPTYLCVSIRYNKFKFIAESVHNGQTRISTINLDDKVTIISILPLL